MEKEIIEKLKQKLDPAFISQREGAGKKQLDYLEAWYCIDKANEIFGFGEWSFETKNLWHIGTIEGVDKFNKPRWTVAYGCTGTVTIGDCVMEGTGFGNGFGKDLLEGHELAMKESESDAKKRCLMNLGNQFGLALYDKSRKNVGKPEIIKTTAKAKKERWQEIMAEFADIEDIDQLSAFWVSLTDELKEIKARDEESYLKLEDEKNHLKAKFSGDYKGLNYGNARG